MNLKKTLKEVARKETGSKFGCYPDKVPHVCQVAADRIKALECSLEKINEIRVRIEDIETVLAANNYEYEANEIRFGRLA